MAKKKRVRSAEGAKEWSAGGTIYNVFKSLGMLDEVRAEADRQDRPYRRVLRRAWERYMALPEDQR